MTIKTTRHPTCSVEQLPLVQPHRRHSPHRLHSLGGAEGGTAPANHCGSAAAAGRRPLGLQQSQPMQEGGCLHCGLALHIKQACKHAVQRAADKRDSAWGCCPDQQLPARPSSWTASALLTHAHAPVSVYWYHVRTHRTACMPIHTCSSLASTPAVSTRRTPNWARLTFRAMCIKKLTHTHLQLGGQHIRRVRKEGGAAVPQLRQGPHQLHQAAGREAGQHLGLARLQARAVRHTRHVSTYGTLHMRRTLATLFCVWWCPATGPRIRLYEVRTDLFWLTVLLPFNSGLRPLPIGATWLTGTPTHSRIVRGPSIHAHLARPAPLPTGPPSTATRHDGECSRACA